MKTLTSFILVAALVALSQPAAGAGLSCPTSGTVTPGPAEACPGASSSACVTSPCPAGATRVGPKHPHLVSAALIQNAITAALPGAVICVRPATYRVTSTINFGGKAITLVAPLGAVLAGNGKESVVTFSSNESSASVLDGFTIAGGGGNSSGLGGGIFIDNASPTIKNCLVTNNSAASATNPFARGGGAFIAGSEAAPTISCTTFANNTAQYEGAGLESDYLAHPYLDYDTFEGNSAPYGAGFASDNDGLANIENSEFLNNAAGVDGGGLHILTQWGATLVRRSVIAGNTAGSDGGGVWVAASASATIFNSVFDGNSAPNGAGLGAAFGSTVNVESSILVNTPSPPSSGTLAADTGTGTTLLNSYNLFFNNFGPDSLNTVNNSNIDVPVSFVGCYCLPPGSPAIGIGMPDLHFFNSYNGARNDAGAHGGPTSN